MKTDSERRSMNAYARGAADGAWMGALLCAIFASWALATRSTVATLAFPAAVPGSACAHMAHAAAGLPRRPRPDHVLSHVDARHLHFFFGTLLMAALALVWLRWLEPGLISQSLLSAADVYAQIGTPEAERMAADIHTLMERGLVPRPVDVSLALLWAGVFSGSILSIVLAAIIRAVGYHPKNN